MRRLIKSLVLSAAVAVAFSPSVARADGYINPWAGVNFGNDVESGRGGFGVSAGAMGGGIIGGEVNFGYSPSFFGTNNDFGNNTVVDLMGNLIVGLPIGGQRGGGFRPYVTGGLGMIRTQIDGGTVFDVQISDNDFGWNAGAGIMGYFNDHVGLRGDIRYLSNFSNSSSLDSLDFDGNFNYWRGSVGLVIR
jgi:opacity protein-like surface antigen